MRQCGQQDDAALHIHATCCTVLSNVHTSYAGHIQVPVERSRGGGDYRDMHQPRGFSCTPRSFSADEPVPFGELLDHVQQHRHDG